MPPSDAAVPAAPDWRAALAADGVVVFPPAPESLRWAEAARAVADPLVADADLRAAWLRCEGTWFAGVDVLPNAADGGVGGVPLAGPAPAAVAALGLTPARWHAAQVSVTYPGYPRPREGESAGAARYRMRRDAAHVDGLLPVGPGRRRMLREPHAFVLGLALRAPGPEAAPLVVWRGSHRVIGPALAAARAAAPGTAATHVDLTDAYTEARRAAFARCARVPVPLGPGGAVLLHRHLLHGIAPWAGPADAAGRMTAYFRPELAEAEAWFAP